MRMFVLVAGDRRPPTGSAGPPSLLVRQRRSCPLASGQEHGSVNHLAIALGLILGLGLGLSGSATGSELLVGIAVAFRPVGTPFLNAIQMVVIPLVLSFCSPR